MEQCLCSFDESRLYSIMSYRGKDTYPLAQVKQDLSNYDESLAWPLLLDNYVDWVKEQKA